MKTIKSFLERCDEAGRRVLGNNRGAFDITSVMVGAIILGVGLAAVAATVFLVIPWAQDQAARSSAGSVETSQGIFYSQSADGVPVYATTTDLVQRGFLNVNEIFGEDGQTVYTFGDRDQWAAVVKSSSGNWLVANDAVTAPTVVGDSATMNLTNAWAEAIKASNIALQKRVADSGGTLPAGGLDGPLEAGDLAQAQHTP